MTRLRLHRPNRGTAATISRGSSGSTLMPPMRWVTGGSDLPDAGCVLQGPHLRTLGKDDTHFFMDDDKGGRLMSQYAPGLEDNRIVLQDPGTDASRWIASENKQVFKGAGGLVSTARDYLRFQQAMMNGGELDGVRLLSPNTLDVMMENHTGDLALWLPGPGMGFGLGGGAGRPWRGRLPMTEVRPLGRSLPYAHGLIERMSWWGFCDPGPALQPPEYRRDFQVLASQAIVEQ